MSAAVLRVSRALRPAPALLSRSFASSTPALALAFAQRRSTPSSTWTFPKRLFQDDAPAQRQNQETEEAQPQERNVNAQRSTQASVFIGGIPYSADEQELVAQFSSNPNFLKARIIYGPDGLSRGFGYAEFKSADDVRQVLNNARENPIQILGRQVRVDYATSTHSVPSNSIFISGVSCTDEELTEVIKANSSEPIADIKIFFNRVKNIKQAFVDYHTVESARTALAAIDGADCPDGGRIHARFRREFNNDNNSGRQSKARDRNDRRYNNRGRNDRDSWSQGRDSY